MLSHVIPIYKTIREDPEKYRPVSLTSTPGKIYGGDRDWVPSKVVRRTTHPSGTVNVFTSRKSCLTNLISSRIRSPAQWIERCRRCVFLAFSDAFLVCLPAPFCSSGWGTGWSRAEGSDQQAGEWPPATPQGSILPPGLGNTWIHDLDAGV